MKDLTLLLFERLGLLLVIAFVMTRTPGFRSLLYREYNLKMTIVHACVFGIFGIFSTMAGVVIEGDSVVVHSFVWMVEDNQLVVSMSLMAIVIAGLLGGPVVGLGAGLISGGHLLFLGGIGALANGLVNPLTGLLAGWTARFFSQERVISPFKALFIGVFPPVLQMQMLLILHPETADTVSIVDTIGLPLVLSNSIAIAIFTAMIGIVLREQETEAAAATERALKIAEDALPFLQKDSQQLTAEGIADLLHDRLGLAAVSVTNGLVVLSHRGVGSDHHQPGEPIRTSLSEKAMETKEMQIAYSKAEIECGEENCPLEAAIIIPIMETNEAAYVIKFYFKKRQHIRPVEVTLASGLGQILSNQLSMIAAEKLQQHIRDAELRNLQAQINPHFLFNTLHLIASLFREDGERARHITIQLAHYMRFNIRLVSKSLVPLEKELEHLRAYADIIQERFAGRMEITLQEDPAWFDVKIPPSTLQPLVENSVQHGLEKVLRGGKVDVRMEKQEDMLYFAVRDNGCGFSDETLATMMEKPLTTKQNGGTGLYNVNRRLVSLLGERARLYIENLPDGGSEVSFYIPYEAYLDKEA